MPWGVASAVLGAGASIYDSNQQVNAQQAATAPLQGAQQDLYNRAETIAGTPYTPYTGTQVAPTSANQNQAITQAQQVANTGTAQADNAAATGLAGQIAGNGWNSATAAKYMNPYTQNVTDVAQQHLNQQYANTLNAQDIAAAAQSAYGGDRATLEKAATTGEYLTTSEQTAAVNQANAYNSAIQTWQADNNRAATAASAYETAGQDITNMNSQQIKDLLATGGVAQATQQMDLNAQYNNYLDQRGWSTTELQPLLNAAGNKATPAGVAPTNTASDLLGMGSALAGYFGSSYNPGSNSTPTISNQTPNPGVQYYSSYTPNINLSGSVGNVAPSFGGISSDRRLKRAIEAMGKDGTGLMRYRFHYRGSRQRFSGYMADEVLKRYPKAVSRDHLGFYVVDYGKIPGGRFVMEDYNPSPLFILDGVFA